MGLGLCAQNFLTILGSVFKVIGVTLYDMLSLKILTLIMNRICM